VDIATEFANLIVAQRAFEANAEAVTTFDQITQRYHQPETTVKDASCSASSVGQGTILSRS
jgi:hypothetical protein